MITEKMIYDDAGYKVKAVVNVCDKVDTVAVEFKTLWPSSNKQEWNTAYQLNLPVAAIHNLGSYLLAVKS